MHITFWYEDLKGIMISSWDSEEGNSENSILMCDTVFSGRHLLAFLSPSSPSTIGTTRSGDYKHCTLLDIRPCSGRNLLTFWGYRLPPCSKQKRLLHLRNGRNFYPEYGDSRFVRNFGKYISGYTSHSIPEWNWPLGECDRKLKADNKQGVMMCAG